ncbi:MAG: Ppx/GppA family phosphatase [Gemmataceae bacterium]|nr:Ppx/GppA family phosphatase [Gemmataceae bacterium]
MTGKRLAAIDMGSNSIRLLVTEVAPDGSYRVLDDEKQTTRLALGLAQSGVLSDASMRKSLEALGRMKTIAEGYGVERLEAIATSAVREAGNGVAFLKQIRTQLKLDVEVISPSEEGQLSFASVARHFDLKSRNAVAVDLGGGSAEIVLVANGVVEEIYSLPLGAVRLTDSFLPSDPCTDREQARLKRHIHKCFAQAIGKAEFVPHVMIGAGGTFTALANISMRRRNQAYPGVGGYDMNRAEVRHILDNLKDLPLRGRREVPGLNADRADIIVAGVTVIERLMKLFRVNRLLIHDQGVRDGLMLRMIGRTLRRKPHAAEEDGNSLEGVRQFATACAVEQIHAEHVARLALQLFEQLQGPLRLGRGDALVLEAAALLHEVGNLINYERHHHHSYHLIMHGNLRGLSPHQRELVANVARYHRRAGPKLKHENFASLSAADQQTVLHLSAILRVADGLDRTHMQRVERLECQCRADRVVIEVRAKRAPDVDLWGAQQKGKLFEKVFGRKLKFAWQSAGDANSRGKG